MLLVTQRLAILALTILRGASGVARAQEDNETLRVVIVAGQHHMGRPGSTVADITPLPPSPG